MERQIFELDVPLELFMELQNGEEELRARRVMVSALSFLLGYECDDDDDDDSEASSDEDDECIQNPQIILSREAFYKAFYVITKMLVMSIAKKSLVKLMNEDLLQDLVLYKKLHEKAVSIAACSLITLLREICPSFLVKKDRGRPIDSKARPKAFGEVSVANDVPGVELLKQDDDEPLYSSSEDEMAAYGSKAENDSSPVDSDICARVAYEEDDDSVENDGENDSDEEGLDDRELANVCDTEELNEEIEVQAIRIDGQDEDADDGKDPSNGKKRRLGDFFECLNAVDACPRSLKRLVIKATEVQLMKLMVFSLMKTSNVSKELKTGGLSNRQKQHSKAMPLATKRARVARSCQEKKSGKGKVVSGLGEGKHACSLEYSSPLASKASPMPM
ncbi:hypothetical protein HPP92_006297 [Vanilla planifolia]|uniref:Protein SDA1 n=1 Tax=Vanilla planifolia TaxID=51239 RepID=A0A835S0G0_VANPL|nr:hypothetical protein HPP92_006297 [Vanilla planifolia]